MKKQIVFLAALAVLIGVQSSAQAATWELDASHSSVGFKVRHFFSKVPGSFTNFTGTLEFDADNLEATKVTVEIDATSIDTNNEKRDGHLKSKDFFAVEEFPTITYTSTDFHKGEDSDVWMMEGMLTMRGVEKPVTLNVEFMGSGPDGWGGIRAGFEITGKLSRKEFGITWNKALDHGGTVLSDDIDLLIEIEAVEVQEEAEEEAGK